MRHLRRHNHPWRRSTLAPWELAFCALMAFDVLMWSALWSVVFGRFGME